MFTITLVMDEEQARKAVDAFRSGEGFADVWRGRAMDSVRMLWDEKPGAALHARRIRYQGHATVLWMCAGCGREGRAAQPRSDMPLVGFECSHCSRSIWINSMRNLVAESYGEANGK